MNPNASLARSVISTFDRFGIEYPKDLAAVIARHQTIETTLAGLDSPSIADTAMAALSNGKDPTSDPRFTAAVAAERLAAVNNTITATLATDLHTALLANAPHVLNAWGPTFDTHATVLRGCHEQLGGANLADSTAIVRLGGDAADHWATARATLEEMRHLEQGWSALRMLTGGAADRRTRLAWCIKLNLPQDLDVDLSDASPWTALNQGIELRLSPLDEAANIGPTLRQAKLNRQQGLVAADEKRRRPSLL